MKRIVPDQAHLHDSDEVKRLIDAGFIDNHPPRPEAVGLLEPFSELLATYGPELRQRFSVAYSRTWPEDPYTAARHGGGKVDTALAYVFHGKFDRRLLHELFAHGLVTRRAGDARWIGMHPRLASLYMTALAEAMAPGLGAHPLTDQAFDHVAVSGFTMERLAAALLDLPASLTRPSRDTYEIEQTMVTLAFNNVVPADPSSIPASKIIGFRKAHAEERSLFQAEVARLAAELTYLDKVEDPGEYKRHLDSIYAKTLGPRLERLRTELGRINVDTVVTAASVSFALPTTLSWALASVGVPPAGPAATAAGVAFAAWMIWRKRRSAMAGALKPSPEAYLYHVGRTLTPVELTNEIYARSQLFGPPSVEPA